MLSRSASLDSGCSTEAVENKNTLVINYFLKLLFLQCPRLELGPHSKKWEVQNLWKCINIFWVWSCTITLRYKTHSCTVLPWSHKSHPQISTLTMVFILTWPSLCFASYMSSLLTSLLHNIWRYWPGFIFLLFPSASMRLSPDYVMFWTCCIISILSGLEWPLEA